LLRCINCRQPVSVRKRQRGMSSRCRSFSCSTASPTSVWRTCHAVWNLLYVLNRPCLPHFPPQLHKALASVAYHCSLHQVLGIGCLHLPALPQHKSNGVVQQLYCCSNNLLSTLPGSCLHQEGLCKPAVQAAEALRVHHGFACAHWVGCAVGRGQGTSGGMRSPLLSFQLSANQLAIPNMLHITVPPHTLQQQGCICLHAG